MFTSNAFTKGAVAPADPFFDGQVNPLSDPIALGNKNLRGKTRGAEGNPDEEAISSSDEEGGNVHRREPGTGKSGRSNAMMFDRSLVGDRNGLKTAIIKAVYENQVHLQHKKGEAFDLLAQKICNYEVFRPYNLHGRKLQKSFNKIARDIKDCIIAENEPSRWGKEEPEYFQICRKIFDEAARANVRAFDEKLKSKSIADRIEGEIGEVDKKTKRPKRDLPVVGMGGGGYQPHSQHNTPFEDPDFLKVIDEFINAKLAQFQSQLSQSILSRHELEIALHPIKEKLQVHNIRTVSDLLLQSGVSDLGRQRIFTNAGFHANDSVTVFLYAYYDVIAKGPQAIGNICESFGDLPLRDASVLYNFLSSTAI